MSNIGYFLFLAALGFPWTHLIEGACIDQHVKCRMWSTLGKCYTNYKYMLTCCQESCDSCDLKCTDYDDDCEFWASIGLCEKKRSWMLLHCRKACRRCPEHYLDCKAGIESMSDYNE